jgi:mannose-6-phosphate isomerase-like protein (cupin superfamily)
MEMRFVNRGQGETVDLGHIRMRLLASSSATGGTLGAAEFRGSEGPWTIPHVHEHLEESFYVLEGSFTFTCGEDTLEAAPGAFVVIPRDTPHVLSAGPGGGTLLVVWTPGGLEQMFIEIGGLPSESITDPKVRAEIAQRHDSVPV